MKGTILVCLRDMLAHEKKVSPQQWNEVLVAAGFERGALLLPSADIPDKDALQLFGEAQNRYFTSHEALADAFGHYWSVHYAPATYGSVYQKVRNAREFILRMDEVHVQVTRNIANAQPPRFQFTEVGRNKLLIDYRSHRGLIHIFAGLCRGIGAYYGEALTVQVLGPEQVMVEFPA